MCSEAAYGKSPFDELVANSIANKESIVGRSLTDTEKADMAAKIKALMGS